MRKAVRGLLLLSLCFTLGGCGGAVGLAVGAMGRSAGTGSDYATWKTSMSPPQRGSGRLFVYAADRSLTLNAIQMTSGAMRVFGVDKDVCGVVEATFTYVDVPAGEHVMSTGDMEMLFGKFQRGKYEARVRVADGGTTYVRIDATDGHLAPRPVDAATAEAEMSKLPLDTHFMSFECKKDAALERGA